MKYLLGLLVACVVVGAMAAYAANVSVVAETGEFVLVPTAATAVTTANAVQVSAVTNVVTTTFTPAQVGQLLIGTVSNVVYVAKGTTTNDWIKVSN